MNSPRIAAGRLREHIPLLSAAASFVFSLILTFAAAVIEEQSIAEAAVYAFGCSPETLATELFLALIVCALGCLFRSLFAAGAITALAALALVTANYYKTLITSTPLYLADLNLISRLGGIVELNSASITVSGITVLAFALTAAALIGLFFASRALKMPYRRSLMTALAASALFICLYGVPAWAEGWFYAPMGAARTSGTAYSQAYVNARCGTLLGLWRSVVLSGEAPGEEKPQDVTDDRTPEERLIDDAEAFALGYEPETGAEEQPNVIFVLSESFFDVTELPGVEFENDPVADFHAVQEQGVSGTFYTHTLGYGTSNIEMEVFTGINSRFFGSDENIYQWDAARLLKTPPVPQLFRDAGYYTAYIHTFNDGIYEREGLYSQLGFDEIFFSDDFAAIDPEAAAAPDYWGYMSGKIAGEFYSDDYMADLVVDLCERETADAPVFIWAITMENHTPYTADKYDGYNWPFESPLDEEGEGILASVVEGAADASASLGKLVEYFSQCEEPTVIIFFGDHKPGLPLSDSETVYSALGMCPASAADWTAEDYAEMYCTDYVIWSNDVRYLPAEPGSRLDSSSTTLGLSALNAASIELNSWWRLCGALSEAYTAWQWPYFISADGQVADVPDALLDGDGMRLIEVVRELVKNGFFDGEGPDFSYVLPQYGVNDTPECVIYENRVMVVK